MTKAKFNMMNAPEVRVEDGDLAGDVLVRFYKALGWNGTDLLDPCKVRVSKVVFDGLHDAMAGHFPEPVAIGMALVSKGPGVDDDIPPGKVRLLAGWTFTEQDKRYTSNSTEGDAK